MDGSKFVNAAPEATPTAEPQMKKMRMMELRLAPMVRRMAMSRPFSRTSIAAS